MAPETQRTENRSIASTQSQASDTKIINVVGVTTSSTGSNNVANYGKQVIVRGASGQIVRIPIDIDREIARYDNLIANRGLKEPVSTSTED